MTKRKEGYEEKDDWRSWQAEGAPDPPLLTRTELLALVERWNIKPDVDERTLRYWEKRGLTPRPVRSYHNGAVRSRYPSWVADLIAFIREQQSYKVSLARIEALVREEAFRLSLLPPRPPIPAKPRNFQEAMLTALDGPRRRPIPFFAPPTLPGYAEYYIADALQVIVMQQRMAGFNTERIAVHLADAQGQELIYEVPLPDWLRPTSPPSTTVALVSPPPWWELAESSDRVTDTKEAS
jgi:DNA-binding transcriptional MerR regulator